MKHLTLRRLTYRSCLLLVLGLLILTPTASAQGYIDQIAVAHLLNRRADSLAAVPEVAYDYYVLANPSGNSVYARNIFFNWLGKGNSKKGLEMALLVEMLNRVSMQNVHVGDTLAVPSIFDLDCRAYTPFPRHYEGGRDFDKLFIMDKTAQAFAAYEHGALVRWGVISTGDPEDSPTPNGRFNFNWKEEYRVSTLSPPGEDWEMYWVVNFHQARGMHVHQYEMPTAGPTSHGCVRLVDADAEWVFGWADPWKTTARGDGYASRLGRLLKQGTTVLVLGAEPDGRPQPFTFTNDAPVLKPIELPADPYDVPPGSPQQKLFDRLRTSR